MCLIVVAWRARADLPLAVAANRDEWRERPAQPAHWWPDHPQILAGRDLQAGGTWLGITREGRFAAVTNFRDPSDKRSTARSRGTLVTEFLLGGDSPARFLSNLSARAHEYNGFNLILGDAASLFYYGSREGEPRAIEPGVHGLSNHLLDEPWPKVVRGRSRTPRLGAHHGRGIRHARVHGACGLVAGKRFVRRARPRGGWLRHGNRAAAIHPSRRRRIGLNLGLHLETR